MKKILMLGTMAFLLSTTSALASYYCPIAECNPCEKPKMTCVKPCQMHSQAYINQCCNKKSIFKQIWNGTKIAYDNSVGAIYDTIVYPFR